MTEQNRIDARCVCGGVGGGQDYIQNRPQTSCYEVAPYRLPAGHEAAAGHELLSSHVIDTTLDFSFIICLLLNFDITTTNNK